MRHSWLIALLMYPVCLAGQAQTLREAAEGKSILVGVAVSAAYLSETAYAATLAREFNMLEPEDALKWAALRHNQTTFDFRDADRLVSFAQVHGMKVRGHTLVWGTHNPQWLTGGYFTAQQLSKLLHDHIQQVAGRYRGKIFAWDVVNEAFDEKGLLRDSPWYNQPGIGFSDQHTAYIEQAFRWAHTADPQALLFYNDAEAEAVNRKSDAIYAMVKDFKQRNVPIDGVGLQMHIFGLSPDFAAIAANIDRFTKLGVQINITEMDVGLPVNASGELLHPKDLTIQAEIYRQIAEICLRHSGCTALQTWGLTDKYSWIGWFTHHAKGAGLLFDRHYNSKPAYDALRQVLAVPVQSTMH